MTPTKVHRHICVALDEFLRSHRDSARTQSWEHFRSLLVTWACELDQAVVFEGLLRILEVERLYQYQEVAGWVLDKANVACPLSLEEFMRRVLPLWDVSAGTVPRYAARVFGRDEVLALIYRLRASNVAWPARGTLAGICYHLGEHLAE